MAEINAEEAKNMNCIDTSKKMIHNHHISMGNGAKMGPGTCLGEDGSKEARQ